ncbi:MAG: helix-turn-helix domain-containing protein [Xanthomonadales bacterium]
MIKQLFQAASDVVGLTTPVDAIKTGRNSHPMSRKNLIEPVAAQDYSVPLRQNVQAAIRRYLEDMGPSQPSCLYQTLLAEVEPPLLEEVLRYTHGNQSRTAKILGITRNTLRTKLHRYDIPANNGKS